MISIMYLDRKPILHIVDEVTIFSAARFLPTASKKYVWQMLQTCWATIYIELPHKILVDQGTSFGRMLQTLGALRDAQIQSTGTEAHSYLGITERTMRPFVQHSVRSRFPILPCAQSLY